LRSPVAGRPTRCRCPPPATDPPPAASAPPAPVCAVLPSRESRPAPNRAIVILTTAGADSGGVRSLLRAPLSQPSPQPLARCGNVENWTFCKLRDFPSADALRRGTRDRRVGFASSTERR
jgi:hypothetical protein